jgi:hypothetical protein
VLPKPAHFNEFTQFTTRVPHGLSDLKILCKGTKAVHDSEDILIVMEQMQKWQ